MGYLSMYADYLEHHGIKGQKWGVQNGPPYPLDDDTAKQIKSGDNPSEPEKPKDISGGHLSHDAIESFKAAGYTCIKPEEVPDEGMFFGADKYELEKGGRWSKNNCVMVATNYALNQLGVKSEVVKNHWGKTHAFSEIEKAFPGAKNEEIAPYKNTAELRENIKNKFPDGANGIIGGISKLGFAHCMTWKIESGNVIFADAQNAKKRLNALKKEYDDTEDFTADTEIKQSAYRIMSNIPDGAMDRIYAGSNGAAVVRLDSIQGINTKSAGKLIAPMTMNKKGLYK